VLRSQRRSLSFVLTNRYIASCRALASAALEDEVAQRKTDEFVLRGVTASLM
jgi:hypothetical protein